MRVLFYVDSGGSTGGPGRHSVQIWRALAKRRPDLVGPLVVPHADEERDRFVEQLGARNVRTLGRSALVDPDADPVVVDDRFLTDLMELAAREECDHVHLLWGFAHPRQVAHVPARARLPITVTLCDATAKGEDADVDAMFFGSDRWERYLSEALRAEAGYLAISEKTRRDALSKGVPESAVETVYLWIDGDLGKHRVESPGDHVAFVGGLAEYKGIGHLLDFALAYPEYPVRVTGYPTPDFPIDWPRYPSVTHLGYVAYDEVLRVMSTARAVLYLSYSEGFGLPMIEAQALGVPVVVNPRNVMVRELCRRGSYVAAGDVGSPTSLKAAIDVATRDRAAIAAAGIDNASRFEEGRQVERLIAALEHHHTRLGGGSR